MQPPPRGWSRRHGARRQQWNPSQSSWRQHIARRGQRNRRMPLVSLLHELQSEQRKVMIMLSLKTKSALTAKTPTLINIDPVIGRLQDQITANGARVVALAAELDQLRPALLVDPKMGA